MEIGHRIMGERQLKKPLTEISGCVWRGGDDQFRGGLICWISNAGMVAAFGRLAR